VFPQFKLKYVIIHRLKSYKQHFAAGTAAKQPARAMNQRRITQKQQNGESLAPNIKAAPEASDPAFYLCSA